MNKSVCIFSNGSDYSERIRVLLEKKLQTAKFELLDTFQPEAGLLICVGGDGSFLHALHASDFPDIPVIGINTGHLGFFQEIDPTQIDEFIVKYQKGECEIQRLKTIQTEVAAQDGSYRHTALNDIVLRKESFGSVHLSISLGKKFVQRFSGDGILVCPPAGSTAYNYALGGSIIDPSLEVIQITPIAPMNTTAYRSFTSSVVAPAHMHIDIAPEFEQESAIKLIADGVEHRYENVKNIRISLSDKTVQLLRMENYDFWSKVKSKFL